MKKKQVYWVSSCPMSERVRQAILSLHKDEEVIFHEVTSYQRNPDGSLHFTGDLEFSSDNSLAIRMRLLLRDTPDAFIYTDAGPVYCMVARDKELSFGQVYEENGKVSVHWVNYPEPGQVRRVFG